METSLHREVFPIIAHPFVSVFCGSCFFTNASSIPICTQMLIDLRYFIGQDFSKVRLDERIFFYNSPARSIIRVSALSRREIEVRKVYLLVTPAYSGRNAFFCRMLHNSHLAIFAKWCATRFTSLVTEQAGTS